MQFGIRENPRFHDSLDYENDNDNEMALEAFSNGIV